MPKMKTFGHFRGSNMLVAKFKLIPSEPAYLTLFRRLPNKARFTYWPSRRQVDTVCPPLESAYFGTLAPMTGERLLRF